MFPSSVLPFVSHKVASSRNTSANSLNHGMAIKNHKMLLSHLQPPIEWQHTRIYINVHSLCCRLQHCQLQHASPGSTPIYVASKEALNVSNLNKNSRLFLGHDPLRFRLKHSCSPTISHYSAVILCALFISSVIHIYYTLIYVLAVLSTDATTIFAIKVDFLRIN